MVGITDTKDGKMLENTGDLYDEIATNYPSNNYTQLCNQFGVRFALSEGILKRHLLDYKQAVKEVLNIWEWKVNATRAKLESALKKAETGALCTIVAKHFANVEVHEEEEESDESDEDEVREEEDESDEDEVHEEGEESDEDEVLEEEEESDEDESEEEEEEDSDEEPATVHQSGGAQTINASGRSKVKGSTMTGPVTNMNIHNHPTEASTSQRQGRKRKAAGPSGVKKRAKMGDYNMASAITNMEIEALAKGIGINNKLDGLGLNLGYEYPAIDIYKASNHSGAIVTHQGTKEMLKDWRDEISPEQQRPILKKALEDAGLVRQADMHLGAAPSGSRPKRKRKPATVHQRGGAQTINASGRSKVKGSTMTGPVTKMTIHNYPADQRQAGKRKTAGSSGGKKRQKMGGKR